MHSLVNYNVPSGKLAVHWFGQSSFAIKTPGDTIVLVDPYFPHDRPAHRVPRRGRTRLRHRTCRFGDRSGCLGNNADGAWQPRGASAGRIARHRRVDALSESGRDDFRTAQCLISQRQSRSPKRSISPFDWCLIFGRVAIKSQGADSIRTQSYPFSETSRTRCVD